MLTPGEISKGMYVTVLTNKPFEHTDFSASFDDDGMFANTKTVTNIDRSGMGDTLMVVAVCLPYVSVKRLSGTFTGPIWDFDTRRTTFMELSDDWLMVHGIAKNTVV